MCRKRAGRDEQGAALVLALVFVTLIGLLIGTLVDLSGSSLASSSNLENLRASQYAADGALDGAVQVVRYSGGPQTLTACPPDPTSGSPAVFAATINGENVGVWCQDGSPSGGRQVGFWACAGTQSFVSSLGSLADCKNAAAHVISHAQVLYNDSQAACVPSCTTAQGFSLIVESWTVDVASY